LALYLVHWRHHGGGMRRIVLMGLAVLAGVVLCAWFLGGAQGASRWHVFSARGFDDPARRHAAMMALRIGNDAGWNGTGPGTFEVVSPHYAALDTVTAPGWWRHAHCDYAQFFAEWGWMGCLVLLVGIGMPLRRMFAQWRDALRTDADKSLSCHRRTGLACVSVAVVSLLLHALVDFPFQIMALQNLAVVMAALLGGLSETSSKRGGRLMAR
jgi:O-antigen ligase